MSKLLFSDALRKQAAAYVVLLNDKLLPGLSAIENNLPDYRPSENDGLMPTLLGGIAAAMDHSNAVRVRDILQSIARDDEIMLLYARRTFEALNDLRNYTASLAKLDYYQRDFCDLADFVAGSEEISGHFLRAEKECKKYEQSKKKPYTPSFPDEMKQDAAKLKAKLFADSMERRRKMGLYDDDRWAEVAIAEDKRKEQTGLSEQDIMEKHERMAGNILLSIGSPYHFHIEKGVEIPVPFKETHTFAESAQDALRALNELALCANSLAGYGKPEVQQFLEKHTTAFAFAMKEAEAAALSELSGARIR